MEKSKFAQPVSMVCNKEQFEHYLKKPMEDLGYEPYLLNISSYNPILIAHDDKIKCTSKNHLNSHIYGNWADGKGYFIDHFNPELFLAIAGMREGDDIRKGGYFMCIKGVIMDFSGKLTYKKGVIYKSESDGCITGEQGGKIHGWSKVSYTDEYFRKATLQDLIEKFGKKEYTIEVVEPSRGSLFVSDEGFKIEPPEQKSIENIVADTIMGYVDNNFQSAYDLYVKVGQELESRLKVEKKQLTEKKSQLNKISFTNGERKTVGKKK